MANQIIQGQPNDPRTVEAWVHIDDFHAGVFDNSFISTADPKFSAPLGAADANATFCCASNSNGVLAPLPTIDLVGTYPTGLPGAASEAFITGFAVNPGLNNDEDELVIIWEADDGTTHYNSAYSQVVGGALNQILNSTSATTPGFFGSPYPAWTRMAVDPTTTNPHPELVFPASVATDASGVDGHLYIYPPILAPTSFAVQDLIVSMSSVTGQTIAYGNRVVVLAGVNYPWPAGGGINTNENINFTDPPDSTTYGNQQELFGSEEPWGYGAWGVVSVGQLLLIKKVGGAVSMYGDVASPSSVIPLPGMQSTGDFVGQAGSTQIGLVYCSEDQGAWVWNGGNTSQKMSANLRDNFYDATTPTGMASNNYGFFVGRWQDWILFSNNYMYNADTNSWWVLYPNDSNGTSNVTGHTMFWWIPGRFGDQMYAAPIRFGTAAGLNLNWWYRFNNTVPAPHYQWKSLPMHVVPNAARLVDVLQVYVRVSDPTNTGSATLSVTVAGETLTTTEAIGIEPTLFRFNFGSGTLGLQDILVTLNADNPGASAPYVHSLDIGYKTRALQHSEN